jgi:hypothetical protein
MSQTQHLKCDFCDYEGEDVEYYEDPYVSALYPEDDAQWDLYNEGPTKD